MPSSAWRRERDSNPWKLSLQRFSRPPHSTALPSLQLYLVLMRAGECEAFVVPKHAVLTALPSLQLYLVLRERANAEHSSYRSTQCLPLLPSLHIIFSFNESGRMRNIRPHYFKVYQMRIYLSIIFFRRFCYNFRLCYIRQTLFPYVQNNEEY